MTDPLDIAAENLAETVASLGFDAGEQIAALVSAAGMIAVARFGVEDAAGIMRTATSGIADEIGELFGAGQVRQ